MLSRPTLGTDVILNRDQSSNSKLSSSSGPCSSYLSLSVSIKLKTSFQSNCLPSLVLALTHMEQVLALGNFFTMQMSLSNWNHLKFGYRQLKNLMPTIHSPSLEISAKISWLNSKKVSVGQMMYRQAKGTLQSFTMLNCIQGWPATSGLGQQFYLRKVKVMAKNLRTIWQMKCSYSTAETSNLEVVFMKYRRVSSLECLSISTRLTLLNLWSSPRVSWDFRMLLRISLQLRLFWKRLRPKLIILQLLISCWIFLKSDTLAIPPMYSSLVPFTLSSPNMKIPNFLKIWNFSPLNFYSLLANSGRRSNFKMLRLSMKSDSLLIAQSAICFEYVLTMTVGPLGGSSTNPSFFARSAIEFKFTFLPEIMIRRRVLNLVSTLWTKGKKSLELSLSSKFGDLFIVSTLVSYLPSDQFIYFVGSSFFSSFPSSRSGFSLVSWTRLQDSSSSSLLESMPNEESSESNVGSGSSGVIFFLSSARLLVGALGRSASISITKINRYKSKTDLE